MASWPVPADARRANASATARARKSTLLVVRSEDGVEAEFFMLFRASILSLRLRLVTSDERCSGVLNLRTRVSSRRIGLAASMVTVAALLLTGCQTAGTGGAAHIAETAELPPLSSLTPIADPIAWEGPTTAVIGGPSLAAIADRPEQQLPVTVVSHDATGDREVQVTDASRLLALSLTGTVAELVDAYGLAGNLVGRDISTQLAGYEDLPVRRGVAVARRGYTGRYCVARDRPREYV